MPTAPTPTLTSLDLDGPLAVAGSPAACFARLWQRLWSQPYVAPELLELCRLALARLHCDEEELAARNPHVPPGVPSPERRDRVLAGDTGSSLFSERERAVLAFTEMYGLDAQSITDELAASVSDHLGEAGLVFLIEALGCLDGRIRAARCLRDLSAAAAAPEGTHVR
jgi:hypothetical protein